MRISFDSIEWHTLSHHLLDFLFLLELWVARENEEERKERPFTRVRVRARASVGGARRACRNREIHPCISHVALQFRFRMCRVALAAHTALLGKEISLTQQVKYRREYRGQSARYMGGSRRGRQRVSIPSSSESTVRLPARGPPARPSS